MTKSSALARALVFVLLSPALAYSQTVDTVYLNSDYQETVKEQAAFYKITEYKITEFKYRIETYFISGALKSKKSCLDELCIQQDGPYVEFYENGQKESEGKYAKGSPSGKWSEWYENGQLSSSGYYADGAKYGIWNSWYKNGNPKEVLEYIGSSRNPEHRQYELREYWTPNGEKQVDKGDGNAKYFYEGSSVVSSEGEYKNGYKVGIWRGYRENGNLWYTETYKKSNVSGTSIDENGQKYEYQTFLEQPNPEDGMAGLYKYVGKNMRYPNEARRKGIEGKVFIQFVVSKNGDLINIKTIKGIGGGCNEEAERVIKTAPKWNPGKQRGQPVEVRMILPITFKLS